MRLTKQQVKVLSMLAEREGDYRALGGVRQDGMPVVAERATGRYFAIPPKCSGCGDLLRMTRVPPADRVEARSRQLAWAPPSSIPGFASATFA